MAPRLEQHLLDEAPVLLLHVGSVGQRAAGVLDPRNEVVAQLLELGELQQAGAAATGHGPVEVLARPGGAEQLRQLCLELADLTQQRAPGRALVRQRARNDVLGGWRQEARHRFSSVKEDLGRDPERLLDADARHSLDAERAQHHPLRLGGDPRVLGHVA